MATIQVSTVIATETAADAVANVSRDQRELSVDLFRGLVLVLMFFANMMPGELPWWMYHASHSKTTSLTWVDEVWPAFLFATGLSLVLAMTARLDRGDAWHRLVGHILYRGLGLIWIGGLFSWDAYNGSVLGLADVRTYRLVTYLAIIAAFVNWNRSAPGGSAWGRRVLRYVKPLGWCWLIYATLTIRYSPKPDQLRSMLDYLRVWDFPPSIIASFGYAFLWVTPMWWATRRSAAGRIALMGLCFAAVFHWLDHGYLRSVLPNLITPMSPWDYRILYVLGGTLLGDALLKARNDPAGFRRYLLWLVFFCLIGAAMADHKAAWRIVGARPVERTLFVVASCSAIFWLLWEFSRLYAGSLWFPLTHLGKNTMLGYLASQASLNYLLQSATGIWIAQCLAISDKGWMGLSFTAFWIAFYTLWVWACNRARIYLRL